MKTKWVKEYRKKYMKKYMKEYWQNHWEYHREYQRTLKYNVQKRIYRKKRRKDPKFRLDNNMATAIWYALKKRKAGRRWKELVGYTLEDLVKHLEKQFDENMNWENYGSYWWLDHIKARSSFNYLLPEDSEFQECWALENLQPLEKIANIKKGRS